MHNPLLKEELIHSRDEYTGKKNKRPSPSRLLKRLTRQRDLVRLGKSTLSRENAAWLCENYYLIERGAREVASERYRRFGRLMPVTDAYVKNVDIPDGENMSALYEVLTGRSYATDREIEGIRTCLVYSCLEEIYERCENAGDVGAKIELLRRIRDFDFLPFNQGFSEAERYLRSDPTATWQHMDRDSRELYKRKIRKMAKRQRVDYTTMCKLISQKACDRSCHIGSLISFDSSDYVIYYLFQVFIFLLVFCGFSAFILSKAVNLVTVIICFTLLFPAFETSTRLAAFAVSLFKKSDILPRVEIDSVDGSTSTMVTIPALVSDKKGVDALFSHLEALYLKSRSRKKEDEALYFSLLLDFPESDTVENERDKELIEASQSHIRRLNARYGEHFVLFTRQRVFDVSSGKYVAHERKRGALLELSACVLKKKSQLKQFGAEFPKIKYVVTLDSDTDMSMGALSKMIGTMEHPLNRPAVTYKEGVPFVKKGYGILQPLTVPSLAASFSTPFSLLISGAGGFDTYHGPVFDLFHVLHRRTMFCGKGIFDAETYYEVLSCAFPDGIVLSHDMLEGSRLRAGLMPDMLFCDNVPGNVISYYKRAHRWARGDVQSLVFVTPRVYNKRGERVKNPQSLSDRFVFVSNYLNLLSPIFSCLALFLSVNIDSSVAGAIFVFATSPLWLYSAIQLIGALVRLSLVTLFRRFFTEAVTGIRRELVHFLYSLSSLFFRAWRNFHAISVSLWRLAISKKKLLEWSTAGEVENSLVKKGGILSNFIFTLPSVAAGVVFLVLSTNPYTRLVGIFWCMFFPVAYITSKSRHRKFRLRSDDRDKLVYYAEKTWKFFDSFVDRENNYLPCDNVSIMPSYAVAHRTSPTNIGLYLVSLVAARDFGFIDTPTLADRLENTLNTVEKLPKFKGHLYNWYNTVECSVIGQEYISTVDSGNFIVCIVALLQGLEEYFKEDERLEKISLRFKKIEEETDFRFLYDTKRSLFSIGYNVEKEERDSGYYDLYMSEMRTTDYYAVARGIVEKEHWSCLSRALVARHLLLGSASWSGTAFEYFMPHLFLPIIENSFNDEALGFAFAEQVNFSSPTSSGRVWGTSESGYFAFDRDMNYQYRAFGVPSLSLCRDREKERVCSPYSTFLMLGENPSLCIKNLERLERVGMFGEWGFYEAIDFSPERSGGGFAMVKSYMAHHVGMSIIALANTVFDGIFVKRFMKDAEMGSAVELLQERIPVDAVIMKNSTHRDSAPKAPVFSVSDTLGVCKNRERTAVSTLAGKELAVTVCERGVIGIEFDGVRTVRPRETGELISFLPYCRMGDKIFSSVSDGKYRFMYGRGSAVYKNDFADLYINPSGAFQAVRIRVSCRTASPDCEKGIYIEPCAVARASYVSHPAYADMFFEGFYDKDNNAVILEYHGKKPYFQCFLSDTAFEFELFRERVFAGRDACSEALFDFLGKSSNLSCQEGTLLSPCILARRKNDAKDAIFVIGYGKTSAEALYMAKSELENANHKSLSLSDAYERKLLSACSLSSVDKELNEKMLSCLYETRGFKVCDSLPSHFGREMLWASGVSGDLPVVLVNASLDTDIIRKILKLHKFHYISSVRYDLVFLCEDSGYKQEGRDKICRLMDECRCRFIEGVQGGIFVIGKNQAELYRTAASAVIEKEEDIAPVRLSLPSEIKCVAPVFRQSGRTSGFEEKGYTIDKSVYNPEILWHHIIASDSFGTLVSHRGLGHSWVYNAGLSRLDSWENDRVSSLGGEKLYLFYKGKAYDMCAYATRVSFEAGAAIYRSDFYELRVFCHPKLLYKEVRVKLLCEGEVKLKYKLSAVMGDGIGRVGGVFAEDIGCGILFSSPFSDTLKNGMGYLISPNKKTKALSDGIMLEAHAERETEFVFVMGYAGSRRHFDTVLERVSDGSCEEESRQYAERLLPCGEKTSFSENAEIMYNRQLPLQCAVSRILARTGPYQSGGAWGCRDQAQDMLFLIDTHPKRVKSHLYRIAAHQYVEGDMQHWWHGFRGTRTRCSDDYLWFVLLLSVYYEKTQDKTLFDEEVSYLNSSVLGVGERERYEVPERSDVKENLLLHAKRCLDLFVKRSVGSHGLPFMGSGDWNDGMDAVGNDGGESVWLAFFAISVFYKSFPMFEENGIKTSEWRSFCQEMYESIENNAFFTDRYARAFLSDGRAMGVKGFEGGCELDGMISAAASICYRVSGLGNPSRISASLDSAWKLLYDEKNSLYRLFYPPFKEYDEKIGYVSAYPEGIRENGGQYTHGAVFAALGFLYAPSEKKKNLARAKKILEAILPCEKPSQIFKTEPYVLSADIYSNPTHSGRGGWSFYTGSAGWCRYLMKELEKETKKSE
jgi:cyclic beta-1,2-glucan synthetase